jgi:hypothetical protein
VLFIGARNLHAKFEHFCLLISKDQNIDLGSRSRSRVYNNYILNVCLPRGKNHIYEIGAS